MKKAFALLLGLTLLSGCGIFWANATIGKEIDDVQWTENVILGDKSVVEGVTIQRNTKFEKYMYWDTTYVIGENPTVHTDFHFYETGKGEIREQSYSGLQFQKFDFYFRNDTINGTELEINGGLNAALEELKAEAPAGETTTKRIYLKDYEDYYEFDVYINFPECHYSDYQEDVRNFFKIPVLEDEMYLIGVNKDDAGNVIGSGYSSPYVSSSTGNYESDLLMGGDTFDFYNSSVITEDKIYFTFSTLTEEGDIVDTSQIQGGYGVYSFEYDAELRKLDVSSLKLEYALEPSGFVKLEIDEDKENLLIFTEDKEQFYLTVVDIATMEAKQTLSYGTNESNLTRWYEVKEDYIIAQYDYYEAMLFSKNEDGTYTPEFIIPGKVEAGSEKVYLLNTENAFDWNGEKLVIASYIGAWLPYYEESCGVTVAVVDASGVIFYAEYESSLNTNVGSTGEDYGTCEPTMNNSLKISWD